MSWLLEEFKVIFTIITLMFLLSGCLTKMLDEFSNTTLAGQLTKPRPWGLGTTPEGSPLYQKGWNEGCDSGMGSYGNARYRLAYPFTQDWRLVDDREYYSGWRQGYSYCRWYTYNWVRPWRQ